MTPAGISKAPDKKRPVLVLTRDSAISLLNAVTVAPITSTIRSIPTEVVLKKDDGLPETCAAHFDNIQTVPKSNIGDRIVWLTVLRMREAAAAMSCALGLDEERVGHIREAGWTFQKRLHPIDTVIACVVTSTGSIESVERKQPARAHT